MKWPVAVVISAAMLSAAIAWSSRPIEAGAFSSGNYTMETNGVWVLHLNTDTGALRICLHDRAVTEIPNALRCSEPWKPAK
jgi:hypothetical protein